MLDSIIFIMYLVEENEMADKLKRLIRSYVACYLHVLTTEGYLPYVKYEDISDDDNNEGQKNDNIPLLVSQDHLT
mgnify:FL=1